MNFELSYLASGWTYWSVDEGQVRNWSRYALGIRIVMGIREDN